MEKVGFIGTGILGLPMARRLLLAKVPLAVWNRTLSKAKVLERDGAMVFERPGDVFRESTTVLLMLADRGAIEEVLFGQVPKESLKNRTIVQMGTIGPDESLLICEKVLGLGGMYAEAPVMGSIPQAESGSLIVMAGCDEPLFAKLKPLLAHFGPTYLVGPVGTASTLKLALNHLIGAHCAAFSASLALVRARGLDPNLFMEVLRQTNLYAQVFDKKLPLMLDGSYENPHFPTKHLRKDIALFVRAASEAGLDGREARAVLELLDLALSLGLGDLDYASLFEVVKAKGEARSPHSGLHEGRKCQ